MKLFPALLILLSINLYKSQDTIKVSAPHKFIGFTPSKKIQNVNILVKYFDEFDGEFKPKKVNGLGLGFNMIGIFFPPLMLFNISEIGKWDFSSNKNFSKSEMNKINGLQFSIVNMEPTVTNGVEFNISSNISTPAVINGISISPFLNIHQEMNGVSIATFANISEKCRGVQIGLINSCKDSKGIQIGFWNENGKRKSPIINWNFKTKKS